MRSALMDLVYVRHSAEAARVKGMSKNKLLQYYIHPCPTLNPLCLLLLTAYYLNGVVAGQGRQIQRPILICFAAKQRTTRIVTATQKIPSVISKDKGGKNLSLKRIPISGFGRGTSTNVYMKANICNLQHYLLLSTSV